MNDDPAYRYEDLTDRQQAFVDAYLGRTHQGKGFLNPYQAYQLAGYKRDKGNPYRITENDRVKAVIDEAKADLLMSDTDAALIHTRLSKSTLAPFLKINRNGFIEIDLTSEDARSNLHLLKKVKQKKRITKDKDGKTTATIEYEVEVYDAGQNAERIRRAHGAYGAKGTPSDPLNMIISGFNFDHPDPDTSDPPAHD